MTNRSSVPQGRIRIAWEIDFFDPDKFLDVVDQITSATDQEGVVPEAIIQYPHGSAGRAPLPETEWEKRFAIVRRILATSSDRQITLKRACEIEGISYSTFRDWRRRMEKIAQKEVAR